MANIKFKHMSINNFMSYEHEDIKLDNSGYILISGINNNVEDNAASNGSGKSSIFSALCWCLTGDTPSGNKQVENIYISETTSVKVTFTLDCNEYEIERTKNPSNLYFIVNGEDKSGKGIRDTTKIVEEYLPILSSSLINSVIILGQGLPRRFTNNTPAGRKEVLEKLSNSDFMVADLKSRIDTRYDLLIESYNTKCQEKVATDSTIATLTRLLSSKEDELNNLDKETLEKEILNLSEELFEILSCAGAYSQQIDAYFSLIDECDILTESINEGLENDLMLLNLKDTKELENKLIELSTSLKFKEAEVKKLDSIKEYCPTCGQKIPDVEKVDTSALKSDIATLKSQINNISKEINTAKSLNLHKVKNLELYYDKRRNLVKEKRANIKLKLDIDDAYLSQLISDFNTIDTKLKVAEVKLSALESSILNITQSITDIKKEIEDNTLKWENIVNNIEEDSQRIEIIKNMKSIISREFRGYLLNSVIEFIANRVKIYSNKVFNSNNLEFTLDGNNISITYDNKEYEALSGGEQQKVDIILQLAIRDMLCKYLNFSSNVLVLDEITDSLDSYSSQIVFNLISSELTDVDSIYIISHHTDFEIPYDLEIKVEKGSDKISRII